MMQVSERIRRFVDDELDAAERAALLSEAAVDRSIADELDRARVLQADLALLRAESIEAPDDAVRRIMQRAVARRQQQQQSPWRHLHELWAPRFRVSWGGLALVASGVATLTIVFVMTMRTEATVEATPTTAQVANTPNDVATPSDVEPELDPRVPVRFILPAAGARKVSVVGDFNAWQADASLLDDTDGDGVFAGTLLLSRGSYSYMFVIDGERWTTDPHATNFRDDGFGQRNAVIRVN